MKVTILAAGGALAFASTIYGRLQLVNGIIGTPSTLVTKPTVTPPSTQATVPTETARPKDLAIMSLLASAFGKNPKSTAVPTPIVLRDALNVESTEAMSTLPFTTTTPAEAASSSSSLPPTSAASESSDPQVANAQALQVLRSQRPVFSNSEVAAAKLRGFCGKSDRTTTLCKDIKTQVATCVDAHNNCTENALRTTLAKVVKHDLCKSTKMLSPEYAICARFFEEALRCNNKKRRGRCAIGHIKYLLRQLRDFIGLKAANATVSGANITTTGAAEKKLKRKMFGLF
ncbi:hypothetical protein BDV96DRAFT_567790 [Lophiotrema nucula]|uniref:Uncharacterized protein n=1 Tax=Lophiotrema nucula TaxID=690887 RepID=A0A6A5ZJ17_9PLEO|nr:hypothetical protein BDV96DRAFT_567790 [Lophiotrema nucula]